MALFTAQTLVELILVSLWTCLSTTPAKLKHPIFTHVLSSRIILEGLLSSCSLVFAPGLFEILQALTPPALSWFKSLPTKAKDLWVVYLIVLEKSGCPPKIYIGTGTDSKYGASVRLSQYNSRSCLPSHVEKALDDGYIIVHKGLLCWIPIPSAARAPELRVLFVALEALFTFTFRAMLSRTKDYNMGHMCPWSRDTFEYEGLCSHSPLSEAVVGDFHLTADELEAQAAEIKSRRADYMRTYVDDAREADPDAYHAMKRAERRLHLDRHPDAQAKADKRTIAKNVAEKRHHCHICNHSFTKGSKLTKHLSGPKHAKAARAAAAAFTSTAA